MQKKKHLELEMHYKILERSKTKIRNQNDTNQLGIACVGWCNHECGIKVGRSDVAHP